MVCIWIDNKNTCREKAETVENDLRGFVTEKRFAHILSVRKTALMLCDFFLSLGADLSSKNVELSALLHDITKCMDQGELCKKYGIQLSQDDISSPETLHAKTGAHFAREHYGVCDEIFSAIEKHTVGDVSMSLTDKIIFVSDYCEETRSHNECRRSRSMLLGMLEKVNGIPEDERLSYALRHLDYVIADILAKTVKYLRARGGNVHGKTIEAYESIVSLYDNDESFLRLKEKYNS